MERCENFPCDRKNKWKESQILVGLSTRDSEFNPIDSFMVLKQKIDWNYAKGMLTNMNGYHKLGGKIYPGYRISKELNLKDTVALL